MWEQKFCPTVHEARMNSRKHLALLCTRVNPCCNLFKTVSTLIITGPFPAYCSRKVEARSTKRWHNILSFCWSQYAPIGFPRPKHVNLKAYFDVFRVWPAVYPSLLICSTACRARLTGQGGSVPLSL